MSRRATVVSFVIIASAIVVAVVVFAMTTGRHSGTSYNPPTPSTYPVPTTDPHATTMVTFA